MAKTKTEKKVVAKKEAALPGLAIIGCGIQTRTMLLPQFLELPVVIRTVCDCDRERREYSAKTVNEAYAADAAKKAYAGKCKAEGDFRKVLKDKSISMVVIATPDHWHAYIAVEAMKAGKDVYCEKPLTYSVEEAVTVMAAEKKYKRIFQTGSWQRSRREFRTAAMIVRNGLIGDIKYVDCNYGNAAAQDNTDISNFHANLGGPSHPHRFFCQWDDAARKIQDIATESAPNKNVDWDMWLGPAPWSPYSDQCAPRGVNKFFPMFWRFDDNYGTGYNGDWGAHHLDIAQWGLDMDKSGPVKIVRSDKPHSVNPLHGCRRQYGMKFVFANGVELYHNLFSTWGTVFYGTKGIVAVNRGKIAVWKGRGVKPTDKIREELANNKFTGMKQIAAFYGKDWGKETNVKVDAGLGEALDVLDKFFKLEKAPVQLYKSIKHTANFVECCKTRKPTITPAETGARATIMCLLCNLSYVYDTGFDWNPKKNTFANGTGDPLWLKRAAYRGGWEVKL